MQSEASEDGRSVYTVLVTGANSGLGFATACRLMDEFLHLRPHAQTLELIITTRDGAKRRETLSRLQAHLDATLAGADARVAANVAALLLRARVRLSGELLDLCSLVSVKRLARRLLRRGRRVDVLVLNAGIGGWKGLDWARAVWTVVTDLRQAVTYPTYKLGYVGRAVRRQIEARVKGEEKVRKEEGEEQEQAQAEEEKEPVLGETFTANVFGHYMLAHLLMPLMTRKRQSPHRGANGQDQEGGEEGEEHGRIVWVSSIEAYAHCLDLDDIQGLKTNASYESSKRLTDILVLTSELPATKPWVDQYLSYPATSAKEAGQQQQQQQQEEEQQQQQEIKPKLYLSHPGICGTSIANLHPILNMCMVVAFYAARLLGSPWHTISPYLGAVSVVWLALTPLDDLDNHFERSRRQRRLARSSGSSGDGSKCKDDEDGDQDGDQDGNENENENENENKNTSSKPEPEPGTGKAKWGSSTGVHGHESVLQTQVEGWGWSGTVGERADGKLRTTRGRWRGLQGVDVLDRESREVFEESGRRVWREMEGLRVEWERRLEGVGEEEEEED